MNAPLPSLQGLILSVMGKPIAMDLFCGAGGLTAGLRSAGFQVVGAVDNDPLAVDTYLSNHRRPVVWEGDIRDLSVAEVRRELSLRPGELDLLAGCPPCQGFSSIRTRNGKRKVRDERNDLVLEFARFVVGLKPRVVMMENVPALASDRRIARIMNQLIELGYFVEVRILNAADYGVPQRRRRMVLLAGRGGFVDFAVPEERRVTVRQAIAHLDRAGTSGDELHDVSENRSKKVRQLISRVPKNGGSRASLGRTGQLKCHRRIDGFKDVYGRMMWDEIAPTITGGCINPSKGRFLHPQYNRAITLREAALLQTFPPDYHFSLERGKYAAAVLIGNALPPEFTRRQGTAILRYLARGAAKR